MASGDETNRHEALMRRAMKEARRAEGDASPNPLVGCVIAEGGTVRSTGYHRGPGRAHAEISALESLEGPAGGLDVYVNLEPCCHYGRTPPCTDALLEGEVGRVFVAMEDPDPRVDGDGIRQLREGGIEVRLGLLEEEARRLNRGHVRRMEGDRPWVAVKYAMTLDGKIAARTGDSAWITGERSRRRVHELRDRYDAILVGTGTLRSDDPRLTSRIPGGRNPTRVVLDADLSGSLDSNVYQEDEGDAETWVVVGVDTGRSRRKEETIRSRGIELLEVETDRDGRIDLGRLLEELAERGVLRLFVEGGGTVVGSLFDGEWIDELFAFVAPKLVGGGSAPGPNEGRGLSEVRRAVTFSEREVEHLGGDLLVHGFLEYEGTGRSATDGAPDAREET